MDQSSTSLTLEKKNSTFHLLIVISDNASTVILFNCWVVMQNCANLTIRQRLNERSLHLRDSSNLICVFHPVLQIASGGRQQQQQHKHIGLYPHNIVPTWTNLGLQLAVQVLMTGDAWCHWGKARLLYAAIAIRTKHMIRFMFSEKFHLDKQLTSVDHPRCCANNGRGSLICLKEDSQARLVISPSLRNR